MHSVLVCLHGWGGSKESFTELREAMKDTDLEILTPDLPGFGDEPEPKTAWTVDDYADWVTTWLKSQVPIPNPDLSAIASGATAEVLLLGHSHGGRIAIKLAVRGTLPIEHLYLCASAGIRHPRHFKRIIGLTLAKSGKFFLSIPGMRALEPIGKKFLYRLVRVHDYEKASPVMRETLIKVTQEDLKPLLSQIHIPTDLFWGEEDRMTPVGDGKLMHELIPASKLHLYPGVRHGVHRDRAKEIATVIQKQVSE